MIDYVSVLLGAGVSFLSAMGVLVIDHRLARRREIQVRVLNSYQNFVHFGLQLLDFRNSEQREIWIMSTTELLKAVHDAETFDPSAKPRLGTMKEVASRLLRPGAISAEEAEDLERRIRGVFRNYERERA